MELLTKLAQLADELDQMGRIELSNNVDRLIKDVFASFEKVSFIRKIKNEWCVVSKKGKKLGCYKSRKAAVKRLKSIEYWKRNK